MSWTNIMLIGWPIASLIAGPAIGRFVALRLEASSDLAQTSPSPAEAEAGEFGDSVLTLEM